MEPTYQNRPGCTSACGRASDRAKDRLKQLRAELRIKTTTDNTQAVAGAGLVLLAVKPQILDRMLAELRDHLAPGALLVSNV